MSDHQNGPKRDEIVGRRISSPLKNLIGWENRNNKGQSSQTSSEDQGPPELEIEIETEPDRVEEALAHVRDIGATVDDSFGRLILTTVGPGEVVRIAQSDSIRRIDLYHPPTPDFDGKTVSEGVEISNADLLQDIGLTGDDVTIAVIDIAFNVDNDKFKDQVVGTIGGSSFFDDSDDDEDKLGLHGTATAEIVADMAPDADIVLASNNDKTIGNILDELEDHENNDWDKLDVATHSISYGMNRRIDGLDSISDRIGDFTDGGRLFMTSSGNEASGGNWDGPFRDTNGNDLMEFDESGTERFELEKTWNEDDDEDVTDATGSVDVHWDADWDDDDQDYEVRLYDAASGGTEITSSNTNNPHERVAIPSDENEKVYLEIENIDATGDEHFDIWSNGDVKLSKSTPERSVTVPGVSRDSNTLAVAAVQATTRGRMPSAEDLKNYSSRGPTQDGRRGVDIAAPSFVSQLDPNNDGFNGTSASTPHVGGGAVLLFDPDIGASNDEIRDALFDAGTGIADSSVDAPGPDNPDIGFGYMDVRAARDILEGIMITLDDKWTYNISNRVQFSTPVVAEGNVHAGSLGGDLVALSEADGSESWIQIRDGALSDSSPHLSDETVYVGSGGGVLYAFNLDGDIEWTYTTDSAITASPVVEGGKVFVGSNDGMVHAVRDTDGVGEWTSDVGEEIYSDVTAVNGRVFVTTRGGSVIALDDGNGSELWSLDTGVELGSGSPTVADGTAYVAADDVLALDPTDGSVRWRASYGGPSGSNPVVDTLNDTVYVGSANDLYAFDAANGDREWVTDIVSGVEDSVVASPALAEERVIAAAFEGDVALIDTFIEPGEIVDSQTLTSQIRSSPAVADNDVYIGHEDGEIIAFKGD